MSMTAAYLLARKEPVTNIEIGKPYRVVGQIWVNGAIYTPSKIENNVIYFKGYKEPKLLTKVQLFLVN